MPRQNESSEVVKDRVLRVATDLFAQYGVNGVGIRKIAEEAHINHALIIRYFGSKDRLITEILRREVAKLADYCPTIPNKNPEVSLPALKRMLLDTLNADQNTMRLIVRTELDGLSPESFLDQKDVIRAADIIARWIASQQTDANLPDAKLVAMLVTGAMFSLASIAPWLMTSVGLAEEDFEKKKIALIEVLTWMIARAIGLPEKADRPNNPESLVPGADAKAEREPR